MSGTWRSRHWRQDDSSSSGPSNALRDKGRPQRNHESTSSYNQKDCESSRDVQRDNNTEWRRGQRLPSPPPVQNDHNRTRDVSKSQSRSVKESTNPIVSERKRTVFSAAPANAWGRPSQVMSTDHITTSSSDENTKRAAVVNQTKSDADLKNGDHAVKTTSSKVEANTICQSTTSKDAKPVRQGNPWIKQQTAATQNPNATAFPSLNSSFDKKSTNATSPKPLPNATAPLFLPTTSLWGKSQSRAAATGEKPNTDVASKQSSKEEEYPSLSSNAPPSMQQQKQAAAVASAAPPKNKEKGSKNKAPNLASFLLPQLSGKKEVPTSRSKQNTSSKTVTAVKRTAGVKRTAALSIVAPSRLSGDKTQLHPSIINVNDGPALKKGKQKKKKLTTLKKRVLEERLRVWKERYGIDHEKKESGVPRQEADSIKSQENTQSTTILIENFVRPEEDDLADDDEYDEIISNVLSLAGRVGKVLSVFVPRQSMPRNEAEGNELTESIASIEAMHVGASFVRFSSVDDANAGRDILDGVVVGGQKIQVSILATEFCGPLDDDENWKLIVLQSMSKRCSSMKDQNESAGSKQGMAIDSTPCNTIIFHNILTDDDYDDSDALAESLEDISSLARQYGNVINARAATVGIDKGNVYVSFSDNQDAEKAAKQMNGIVIGGSHVLVTMHVESPHFKEQTGTAEVVIENVLNENDFEDEDCLNESLDDISNIARRHGVIGKVYADTTGEQKGRVHIEFIEGEEAARNAALQLHGMVIGGVAVSAKATSTVMSAGPSENQKEGSQEQGPRPIYSGDKVIPERFAECKRVPKIPNAGPRSYAVKINDDRAVPLLVEMLGELMRLQERSKDDKNARARRRLVMGLREVARGIRAHKVKMVVMANNLDEYGAIDAKLQEILEIARAEDVPVVFEFNKRKLGKAIGKSIKVSVVGIQSADGAQEQFKKLRKILGVA
jgi:selenocysteine insertion sequence-binding protein 2